jgi:hypothetical protein
MHDAIVTQNVKMILMLIDNLQRTVLLITREDAGERKRLSFK